MAFAAGWPVRMSRASRSKGSGTRLSSRFRTSGSGAGTPIEGGARRLSDAGKGTVMNHEANGLKRAIELMEEALECLVDPDDGVVAMRLSHALDLARERLDGSRL